MVDPAGVAVANAEVAVVTELLAGSRNNQVRDTRHRTRTTADGRFVLRAPNVANAFLSARHPAGLVTSAPVEVKRDVKEHVVQLAPGGTLRGRVLAPVERLASGRLYVWVRPLNDRQPPNPFASLPGYLAADGTYRVRPLPPGRYHVKVPWAGYARSLTWVQGSPKS